MTKDTKYVPILKWKRAEHNALASFSASSKNLVTPLIEVVLPTVPRYKDKEQKIKKTDEEMLFEMVKKYKEERVAEIPAEINTHWGSYPIYLDFSLIHDGKETTKLKVDSINSIIPAAADAGLHVIPVVNLNDDSEIKKAAGDVANKYNEGICVRIGASDLNQSGRLNEKLGELMTNLRLDASKIDLLIDLKGTQDGAEYERLFSAGQKIDSIHKWRNFILASGAFPVDLSKCKLDDPTILPRHDWLNWLNQVPGEAGRKPTYADYTIRTPLFDESLQFHNATTSIKYTVDDGWYVMKGKVRGFSLFLVNAKLLVESSGHFYGESFSPGDSYVLQKAKRFDAYIKDPSIKGTGTNETWIEAGISHHLALVVHQVANLGKKSLRALSQQEIPD